MILGLYFAVFSAVFVVACLKMSARNDKYINLYVLLLYTIITVMLCLRFGQGTDYFTYRFMFDNITSLSSVSGYYHGEPLYLFLCYVFNYLTGDFRVFIAVISLAEMIMLWTFISRRSANKAVSVMVMITVMYLFYLSSIVRQGFAMSIFLCFGLELAEKRKWIKYFMLCFILTFLHYVSIIFFVVPLVLKFRVQSIVLSIPVCTVLSFVILRIIDRFIPYSDTHSIRLIAAAERALSFMMIYTIYSSLRNKSQYRFLMKLYCFGTALYFLFLPVSLVASRLAVCFKALEIIIVPCFMMTPSRYRKLFMYYFFVLCAVMFVHSVGSEIENGGYSGEINAVNYPYVSVFNAEDIYNYRKVPTVLQLD